jgi:hypothetical protein
MKFSTAALLLAGATVGSAFVPAAPRFASFVQRPLQMSTAAEPETFE